MHKCKLIKKSHHVLNHSVVSPMPKDPEAEETRMHDEQEGSDAISTPKPVGALICGMRGDSSVVKYKITATPGYDTYTIQLELE